MPPQRFSVRFLKDRASTKQLREFLIEGLRRAFEMVLASVNGSGERIRLRALEEVRAWLKKMIAAMKFVVLVKAVVAFIERMCVIN